MDFKDAEFQYKSGLVHTAAPSRMILLLYNKLLVELKNTRQWSDTDKLKAMHHLNVAFKVLSELLKIFITTPDPAYQALHRSHDPQAQRITVMFARQKIEPQVLGELIDFFSTYHASWKKALNIKPRKFKRPNPLNVNRQPEKESQ